MKSLPSILHLLLWTLLVVVSNVSSEEKGKYSILDSKPIRVEDYGTPPVTSTIALYDCSNSHRPKVDVPSAFEVYHNKQWHTQACEDGLTWNQTLCRCEFPNGNRLVVQCKDYRATSPEPAGKYEQLVNGQWIVRDCSLVVVGLVWDQEACQCVWGPDSKEMVTGQAIAPCEIMLNMTFENGVKDEARGSFVEVGRGNAVPTFTVNAKDTGDGRKAAYFTDTALNIWYFAGNEMGTSLRVEFRFKMTNDPAQRDKYQIFISNGCNVSAPGYTTPSLAIGYRAADQSYLLAFETASARKAIVCTRKLGAYDWHTVSLIYEDGTLLFRVDDHPCIISQDFSGPVQKTPCPLTIGADPLERESMYKGYFDNLLIARYCRRFIDTDPASSNDKSKGPMPVESAPNVPEYGIQQSKRKQETEATTGKTGRITPRSVSSSKYFPKFTSVQNERAGQASPRIKHSVQSVAGRYGGYVGVQGKTESYRDTFLRTMKSSNSRGDVAQRKVPAEGHAKEFNKNYRISEHGNAYGRTGGVTTNNGAPQKTSKVIVTYNNNGKNDEPVNKFSNSGRSKQPANNFQSSGRKQGKDTSSGALENTDNFQNDAVAPKKNSGGNKDQESRKRNDENVDDKSGKGDAQDKFRGKVSSLADARGDKYDDSFGSSTTTDESSNRKSKNENGFKNSQQTVGRNSQQTVGRNSQQTVGRTNKFDSSDSAGDYESKSRVPRRRYNDQDYSGNDGNYDNEHGNTDKIFRNPGKDERADKEADERHPANGRLYKDSRSENHGNHQGNTDKKGEREILGERDQSAGGKAVGPKGGFTGSEKAQENVDSFTSEKDDGLDAGSEEDYTNTEQIKENSNRGQDQDTGKDSGPDGPVYVSDAQNKRFSHSDARGQGNGQKDETTEKTDRSRGQSPDFHHDSFSEDVAGKKSNDKFGPASKPVQNGPQISEKQGAPTKNENNEDISVEEGEEDVGHTSVNGEAGNYNSDEPVRSWKKRPFPDGQDIPTGRIYVEKSYNDDKESSNEPIKSLIRGRRRFGSKKKNWYDRADSTEGNQQGSFQSDEQSLTNKQDGKLFFDQRQAGGVGWISDTEDYISQEPLNIRKEYIDNGGVNPGTRHSDHGGLAYRNQQKESHDVYTQKNSVQKSEGEEPTNDNEKNKNISDVDEGSNEDADSESSTETGKSSTGGANGNSQTFPHSDKLSGGSQRSEKDAPQNDKPAKPGLGQKESALRLDKSSTNLPSKYGGKVSEKSYSENINDHNLDGLHGVTKPRNYKTTTVTNNAIFDRRTQEQKFTKQDGRPFISDKDKQQKGL